MKPAKTITPMEKAANVSHANFFISIPHSLSSHYTQPFACTTLDYVKRIKFYQRKAFRIPRWFLPNITHSFPSPYAAEVLPVTLAGYEYTIKFKQADGSYRQPSAPPGAEKTASAGNIPRTVGIHKLPELEIINRALQQKSETLDGFGFSVGIRRLDLNQHQP